MKKLFIILVVLVGLLGVYSYALAQTPSEIEVGKPATITFNHDGQNTSGYRVFIDSQQVGQDIPISALVTGTVTTSTVVATRGTHTVGAQAFNPDRASNIVTVPFTAVLPKPTDPVNLKIQIAISVAEDGTVTFKVVKAE